jgi:hypothetical protein
VGSNHRNGIEDVELQWLIIRARVCTTKIPVGHASGRLEDELLATIQVGDGRSHARARRDGGAAGYWRVCRGVGQRNGERRRCTIFAHPALADSKLFAAVDVLGVGVYESGDE